MSEPVSISVPVFDRADSEINTIGQIIWLLERRANIAEGLQPPMLEPDQKARIVGYLSARYMK